MLKNANYIESTNNLAKRLVKAASLSKIYEELAKMGEHHPELQRDTVLSMLKIYNESFPDITPITLKQAAEENAKSLWNESDEKRAEYMAMLRSRDILMSGLTQLFLKDMEAKKVKKAVSAK